MNHTASKIKVFQTDNYGLFQFVEGNRPINTKKIDRIIAEIMEGNDILSEVPVLVKENKNKLDIMDGQHRFEISKKLSRPVFYIVHNEKLSLHNVAKINSNNEKWKDEDFIACYSKRGNDHYKKLQKFKKTYGVATGVCLVLLQNGMLSNIAGGDEKMRLQFEQGLFEVKKLKEATMIIETCKSFEKFSAWNSRSFVIAICKLIDAAAPDFKMDILLRKFNAYPDRLKLQSSWKAYMNNLEEVYNIDNNKRRVIY